MSGPYGNNWMPVNDFPALEYRIDITNKGDQGYVRCLVCREELQYLHNGYRMSPGQSDLWLEKHRHSQAQRRFEYVGEWGVWDLSHWGQQ